MVQLVRNARPMIIAIDFDGTLFDGFHTGDYWNNCMLYPTPLLNALIDLKNKYKNCLYYILFTCRCTTEELEEIIDLCEDYGITFDAINTNYPNLPFETSGKVYADLYLDNRANGVPIDCDYIENYIASIVESDLIRPFTVEV